MTSKNDEKKEQKTPLPQHRAQGRDEKLRRYSSGRGSAVIFREPVATRKVGTPSLSGRGQRYGTDVHSLARPPIPDLGWSEKTLFHQTSLVYTSPHPLSRKKRRILATAFPLNEPAGGGVPIFKRISGETALSWVVARPRLIGGAAARPNSPRTGRLVRDVRPGSDGEGLVPVGWG